MVGAVWFQALSLPQLPVPRAGSRALRALGLSLGARPTAACALASLCCALSGYGERSPPGATSRHPRGAQHPAGHACQRASAGAPPLHTRAHSKWAADPDRLPQGGAAGTG